MSAQKIVYLVVGLVAGFAAGFFFTNTVNRKEHDALRSEVAQLRASAPKTDASKNGMTSPPVNSSSTQQLSDEELKGKIAQADANPADAAYQRDLGQALYKYALNFGKPDLLPDVVRLLKRAQEADPKEQATTVLLGNALLLLAQNGDPARYVEARSYYIKALESKPDDVNVRTLLGMTFYYDKQSDPQRAIKEYRRALALNPKHEMAIQSLAAALIATGELVEARKHLDELRGINPSNPAVSDLSAQLSQKTNAAAGIQGSEGGKERQ